MAWQIPTPDRPKLLKLVKTFFLSQGWIIKEPDRVDGRIDLVAKNREMTYFITVVDEAQKRSFRMDRMIEGMAHDSHEIRGQKRQTLAYVLNFRFPTMTFETLAERGISAFALDEMHILTSTAAYQDNLPPPLGVREMLLLEGNAKACISISDRFQKLGDRAAAIKWARHSLTLKGGVTVAHSRLFKMHLEEGDLESAERVGQEVFYFQPKNTEFLAHMEKLALKLNDPATAEAYRARRASEKLAPAPPRTFEDMIKRRQAQLAVSNSNLPAAELSAEAARSKTFVGKFIDRLRGSGGGH